MGNVAVLPRVLVHRTLFEMRIEWHRGSGLWACDPAGRCRPMTPDELRRQFLGAWPAWIQQAALLPPDEVGSRRAGPQGGTAA